MDLQAYFQACAQDVNDALDRLIPSAEAPPVVIHQAMRYSLFAGGKRLRPVLTLATGEALDADRTTLLPVACAIEMIHTYSLIHDDLPALDNDDWRRGRPTCHKVFGEAMAILAGDALLTRAFQTLAAPELRLAPAPQLQLLREVSQAAGTESALIGGQVLDLEAEGQPVDAARLEQIHNGKTGAMIRVAVRAGAITAGASPADLEHLTTYAEKIGLAFQITDDLLDITATSEELGKTPGKDLVSRKATYPAIFGVETSRAHALHLSNEAIEALTQIDAKTERLAEIARFIVNRRS